MSLRKHLGQTLRSGLRGYDPEADFKTLVYPPTKIKKVKAQWKRPEILAGIVILITLVLAVVFG